MTGLWTMGAVAGLLRAQGGWQHGLAVLAPPALSRLCQMVGGAPPRHLAPAWFHDSLPPDAFPLWHDKALPVEGLAAGQDRDEVLTLQPLMALSAGWRQSHRRLRRVDSLAGNLRRCDVVVMGSGAFAVDLLAGALGLIVRHRPLVVLDMGTEGLAAQAGALLPQWSPVPPPALHPHGRFLVLALSPGLPAPGEPCVETGLVDLHEATVALAQRQDGAWLWHGQSPGMVLALEQPAGARRLELAMEGALPHGLRLVLGAERLATQGSPRGFGAAVPPLTQDRLITLAIAPIRLSTTQRLGPLVLRALRFEMG